MRESDHFLTYSNCPICFSSEQKIIVPEKQLAYEREFVANFFREAFHPECPDYMFKDHIYFTHTYDAQLVECMNCGHISRDPRLSPAMALEEYSGDNYHIEWLEASYRPYCELFLQDMPRLIQLVGKDAKVLEIGSQVGGFLHATTVFGWDVKGVDVGKDMAHFAQSKGFNVFEGSLEAARFPDNNFDAVFVWSCFEMLPNPWDSVQEMYRVLKPNGLLFITVPNGNFIRHIQPLLRFKGFRSLHRSLLRILAYDILAGYPFQFGYTPSSISTLLMQDGFQKIRIQNLLYIPVSGEQQLKPSYMIQKKRLLILVHYIAQVVYYLSMQRVIIAPWIEVISQKPVNI